MGNHDAERGSDAWPGPSPGPVWAPVPTSAAAPTSAPAADADWAAVRAPDPEQWDRHGLWDREPSWEAPGQPGGSDWAAPDPGGTFIPLPWSPDPPVVTRTRSRRWLIATVIVALACTSGGLGWLSYHNDQTARRWRALEESRAARLAEVTAQLDTANQRISTLNGDVRSVDAELASLQSQLSSVANQKEKALDQASALQQLLSAAGTVADDLQQCIDATNTFQSDFSTTFDGLNFSQLPKLQSEAKKVNSTCSAAESANQNLQSAIQSAP